MDGEQPGGTPGLMVGDVCIEVTVDTRDALAEVDRFTQHLARAVQFGDRATRIVTLGDLAAVIIASSGFLGVITAPGARVDSARVGRAVHSTLVLVEQLARGA